MACTRVAVVGGGFSGLSCAMTLLEAGIEVEVFEARQRVGGRVWSQFLVPGDRRTVVERGGEFVLDGYSCLERWIARLGLSLADTTMRYNEREPRGGPGRTNEAAMAAVAAQFAAAARKAEAWPETPTVAALAATMKGDTAAMAAFLARVQITNAISPADLAARATLGSATSFERRPSRRVV